MAIEGYVIIMNSRRNDVSRKDGENKTDSVTRKDDVTMR